MVLSFYWNSLNSPAVKSIKYKTAVYWPVHEDQSSKILWFRRKYEMRNMTL